MTQHISSVSSDALDSGPLPRKSYDEMALLTGKNVYLDTSRYNRVALQCTHMRGRKKVRCNDSTLYPDRDFPLREIGTWEKVRYNGGYVITVDTLLAITL